MNDALAESASIGKARLELGLWLVFTGLAFAYTFEFSNEIGTYKWGAASWPRAVILLLVLSALVHYRARLRAIRAGVRSVVRERIAWSDRFKVLGMLVIPLVYVYLLPRTGFYLTTPVFLFAYLYYLGERRWRRLILAPIAIFALINLVFTKLFFVALPTGVWPGFYDLSNWFLGAVR